MMKMILLQVLILSICSLAVFSQDLENLSGDNQCSGDTGNYWADLLNEEKQALEIQEALQQKYKITVKKLFKFTSGSGLHIRSNLPHLKKYIAGRIEQFHELDLPLVFQLLGKIGQVLRVAYAGCKGYQCESNVRDAMRRYQDLITASKRLAKQMVQRCIRSLKYHYYAYAYHSLNKKDKSLQQFDRTIAEAERIKDDSTKITSQTEELRDLSKKASSLAIEELATTKEEKEEYEAKLKEYKLKEIEFAANVDSLKKQIKVYKKMIKLAQKEEAKVDTKEEFIRKKSILSQQCVLVNTPQFVKVCKQIRVLFFFKYSRCKILMATKTERDCRMLLDKDLLESRNEQLRRLAKLRKALRDRRLKLEEKKLEIQLMQRQQFAELQKTGMLLAHFKNLATLANNNLAVARTSLDLADKSMNIVQTQLQKMVDFWGDVIDYSKDIVKSATDDASHDLPDGLKEKILDSGFSWLALGKVLRIAAFELRGTQYVVDHAFMTFPTTAEIPQVIEKSEEILQATIELAKKYEDRIKETEETIQELEDCNDDADAGDGLGDDDEIDLDDIDVDDIDDLDDILIE